MLIAIWTVICILAGLDYQQSKTIKLLNQLLKDDISGEEKEAENKEEIEAENNGEEKLETFGYLSNQGKFCKTREECDVANRCADADCGA